jgi:hypothetical protein
MSARHLMLPVAAVLFGLPACASTPSPAPIATAPPSTAPTADTPTGTTPATKAPAVKAPTPPAATKTADRTAEDVKCPSAATLERAARNAPADESLPENWRLVHVECWKGWVRAGTEGPNTGDGKYLFRYRAGSGWRYHSQGSAYECKALGIHERSPFCV